MTSSLLAQQSAGVLLRSFLIALVLVAPVAAWQWRRIRARRVVAEAQHGTAIEGGHPVGAQDPRALETIVASIPHLAATTAPGEYASLRVPLGVTVEGRAASQTIVEGIVRDALFRDGLEVVATSDLPEGGATDGGRGWTFECRKR